MDTEALARRGYDSFAAGDVATLHALLADDVLWVEPGETRVSGEHKGRDATLAMLGSLAEITGGTFVATPKVFMVSGDHAAVLVGESATRDGHQIVSESIHYFRYRDEQIVEFHDLPFDMGAFSALFA